MFFRKIFFLLLLQLPLLLSSQNHRCGFESYLKQELSENPEYEQKLQQLEKTVKNFKLDKNDTLIRIPVVFHIVYRTGTQNISNKQIISQLEALNEDYRMLNSDIGIVDPVFPKADTKIEFCFAGKDTNGMDFSGVTRKQTNTYQIGQPNSNELFKQQPVWDSKKYLNIYVCEIGGGIAGYSSFPGGNPAKDAIVIDYTNFGKGSLDPNYNLGRTAIHEVGHWLGLYHIWGINENANCNNDDMVADTPNQGKDYRGCPIGPQYSCGSQDMTSNYMGYVFDRCMAAFTPGQSQRMRAMILSSRPNISSSIPCSKNPIQAEKDTIKEAFPLVVFPNPTEDHLFVFQKNIVFSPSDFKLFSVDGREVMARAEEYGDKVKIDFTTLNAGIYLLQIRNEGNSTVRKVFFLGLKNK